MWLQPSYPGWWQNTLDQQQPGGQRNRDIVIMERKDQMHKHRVTVPSHLARREQDLLICFPSGLVSGNGCLVQMMTPCKAVATSLEHLTSISMSHYGSQQPRIPWNWAYVSPLYVSERVLSLVSHSPEMTPEGSQGRKRKRSAPRTSSCPQPDGPVCCPRPVSVPILFLSAHPKHQYHLQSLAFSHFSEKPQCTFSIHLFPLFCIHMFPMCFSLQLILKV